MVGGAAGELELALGSLGPWLGEWGWVVLCLPELARSELDAAQCACSRSLGQEGNETNPSSQKGTLLPVLQDVPEGSRWGPSLESLQKIAPSLCTDVGMRRHKPWLCPELGWETPWCTLRVIKGQIKRGLLGLPWWRSG